MTNTKKRIAAALTAATLSLGLAVPAVAAEAPAQQTKAFTVSADHWSREDYSQEANPEVFTAVYAGSCTTPSARRWRTPAPGPPPRMTASPIPWWPMRTTVR